MFHSYGQQFQCLWFPSKPFHKPLILLFTFWSHIYRQNERLFTSISILLWKSNHFYSKTSLLDFFLNATAKNCFVTFYLSSKMGLFFLFMDLTFCTCISRHSLSTTDTETWNHLFLRKIQLLEKLYNINKIINHCFDFSDIEKKAHSNPPNWEFQTVCHDSDWQADLCLWNLGPQLVLEGVL